MDPLAPLRIRILTTAVERYVQATLLGLAGGGDVDVADAAQAGALRGLEELGLVEGVLGETVGAGLRHHLVERAAGQPYPMVRQVRGIIDRAVLVRLADQLPGIFGARWIGAKTPEAAALAARPQRRTQPAREPRAEPRAEPAGG